MTLNCFIPIFHQMFERRKLLSVVGAYKLLVNNAILLKILLGNHQFRFNFIILHVVIYYTFFLYNCSTIYTFDIIKQKSFENAF